MQTLLVGVDRFFDNTPPVDRFSPEYIRAKRELDAATFEAALNARRQPINVFDRYSNSPTPKEGPGTVATGGYTDRDISEQARNMARDVSRSDVVPFRKATPPPPPRQPAVPLRPAAFEHPWKRAVAAQYGTLGGESLGDALKKAVLGGRFA